MAILGTGTFSESVWNNINASKNLHYLGTVRDGLAFLATLNLMVFGSGGLAYGGINLSISQSQLYSSALANVSGSVWLAIGNSNYSNTQVGFAVGGGMECMFMPNLSAKAEYL